VNQTFVLAAFRLALDLHRSPPLMRTIGMGGDCPRDDVRVFGSQQFFRRREFWWNTRRRRLIGRSFRLGRLRLSCKD
jgi:hypothetical protein